MATEEAARTLPALFEKSVTRHRDRVFLWEKREARYAPRTYADVRDDVHRCAAGFMAIGLRKGDRVALIAEGRN
ncbi:MAG TPA: AMP-binding protein, partial [Bacteroidota bacterium]|nr:AMP-binding protein [Bacteroidota bacterium]